MSDNARLKVVLCWHMHQPEYRDLTSGDYQLPWTYLHAIKDYVDMVEHLESVPKARAVVNFVPILLEQIDDYARQVSGHLNQTGTIKDPLLRLLDAPVMPADIHLRKRAIKECLRVNRATVVNRFEAYRKLAEIADWMNGQAYAMHYISDQFLVDMVVWYHLAWLGEYVRRKDARVKRLIEKGQGFTVHDRHELMQVIGELLAGLLARYRALHKRGQIELSMTPYAHPIAPLLLSLDSTREAMPDVQLPLLEKYPGGEERLRRHIEHGRKVFEQYFGFSPAGCWPAEGAVSTQALQVFDEAGFKWVATGASVLRHTLHKGSIDFDAQMCKGPHQAYRIQGQKVNCFFRDDGLSDLIGFSYSNWHADDAVANLAHHLENIAHACKDHPGTVVSVILDGENAWEYYPENAYYFLSALYRRLAEHPLLELTTFSDCIEQGLLVSELNGLVAGSWVYGTFSTWIGDPDKNRGWDMLGDAKRCYDKVIATGKLSPERRALAEQQLFVCEGSDWFWWFGDYNPADSVSDFERMFRMHLAHLYELLGVEPPEYLTHSFTHGGGAPAMGGAMRPGQMPS
ncbi:MAG: glycoside hydrolase family 57 protein [Pseudomonadota bacterium]